MTPESETIVVELRPYQERRRTRSFAAGILLGLAFAAFVVPAIVRLAEGRILVWAEQSGVEA